MRVTFVGGGSIGHLAPLVAVWRAIEKDYPGSESMFLCSDRPADVEYLKAEKVFFHALPAIRRGLSLPTSLWKTYRETRRLLGLYEPHVILSKGGGISVPACFAAKRAKIPFVIHESDAIPGKATKLLSRWASAVCIGFPLAKSEARISKSEGNSNLEKLVINKLPSDFGFRISDFVYTGNPVRPDITQGSRERGLKLTGLSGKRPILLVLGGSQGAVALNKAIARNLHEFLLYCDVAHITGPGKQGARKEEGYWHAPIAYAELPDILAIADMALSRAGAGTIGELAACSIPTILVPLRGVAHDHQQKNAEVLAELEACILLDQEEIDAQIMSTVRQFLNDPVKAKKIAKQLHSLHTASASGHIAKVMFSCIAEGGLTA